MLLRSSSTPVLGSLNLSSLSHPEIAREVDLECDSLLACRSINRTVSCQNPVSATLSNPTSHGSIYLSSLDDHVGGSWEVKREIDSRSRVRRAQSEGDLASLSNGFACKFAANSLINSSLDGGGDLGENESSLHRQWRRRLKHGSHMGYIDRSFGLEARGFIQEESDSLTLEQGSESDDVSLELEVEQFSEGRHSGDQEVTAISEALMDDMRSSSVSGNEQIAVPSEASISGRRMECFTMEDGQVYTSFAIGRNGLPVVCNSKGCRPVSESEKMSPMYIASGLGSGMGGGYVGGSNNNSNFGGNGADPNSTEAYYQRLLRDDPQNALVLRNFAQFLCEVKHDKKRAEEYYERAVLAAPSDGDVLSHYANLIWDVHKDQNRAESYYNQAVQVAPDDSYVLASYASFLWDSEDNEQSNSFSLDKENASLHPTLQGRSSVAVSA